MVNSGSVPVGDDRVPVGETRPPPRRRWLIGAAILAAAAVAFVIATTAQPSLAQLRLAEHSDDPQAVGRLLTETRTTGSLGDHLSLFAADAHVELVTGDTPLLGDATSLEAYRQYLEEWAVAIGASWSFSACQWTGGPGSASMLCQVAITDDWLAAADEPPYRGRVTFDVTNGEITKLEYRTLRSANDVFVARFREWTTIEHPDSSMLMWKRDAYGPVPVFSAASARLHLGLLELFLEDGSF